MSLIICSMFNFLGIGIDDFQFLLIGVWVLNCSINGVFSIKDFVCKVVVVLNYFILFILVCDDIYVLFRQEIEGVYWLVFECGLLVVGKCYLFIDEVQNICCVKGRNGVGLVFDVWKCVVEDIGVVLVLIGIYEFYNVMQNLIYMLGCKSFVYFF